MLVYLGNMHKKDWVLFIGTFVVGILTGMYLYFTTFVPAYIANPDINKLVEESRSDLQITAEAYGGCTRLGCPSFSITGDRHYRYSSGVVRNVSANIETGDLPRALFAKLEEVVAEADLVAMASPASKQCTSWVDGVDIRYVIVIDGITHELDTCTTRFEPSSELGQWLAQATEYMHNPDEYDLPTTDERGGVGGAIEERLKDSFPTTN